jgi:hypothetical protein
MMRCWIGQNRTFSGQNVRRNWYEFILVTDSIEARIKASKIGQRKSNANTLYMFVGS